MLAYPDFFLTPEISTITTPILSKLVKLFSLSWETKQRKTGRVIY